MEYEVPGFRDPLRDPSPEDIRRDIEEKTDALQELQTLVESRGWKRLKAYLEADAKLAYEAAVAATDAMLQAKNLAVHHADTRTATWPEREIDALRAYIAQRQRG
jgi:hypothetical protein